MSEGIWGPMRRYVYRVDREWDREAGVLSGGGYGPAYMPEDEWRREDHLTRNMLHPDSWDRDSGTVESLPLSGTEIDAWAETIVRKYDGVRRRIETRVWRYDR